MATSRFRSDEAALDTFYEDLSDKHLQPLWKLHGLLTPAPEVRAIPYRWCADDLAKLGRRAGDLVPIDRGGDRRVLAMSNPGLGGAPYISSTLWAAVQYLQPHESAPAHRHTPAALRFVLDGEGVYTLVDGDPITMARGDLVLTPSWTFHEHHNPGDVPMMWLDVLDLPVVAALDAVFFEAADGPAPDPGRLPRSVAERRWGGGAGLAPAGVSDLPPHSPLLVYRWQDTDAALDALLDVENTADATIRFRDPGRDRDVMPTMRCEMRRVLAGTTTHRERQTGTRVSAVLDGSGTVVLGGDAFDLSPGDVFVVPSWCTHQLHARTRLDLFTTSDSPVLEALHLHRSEQVDA
ncbi:cupin domain-containing protein [Streptomyces fuscichromogenes]|uniref:Gentisate 1,2-dioxygenase n=1 Tax=Streptomyces fuscichromogenes TaxID=1324013 RepID=A0A918CTH1_9ACTN|nr:cupin domain-containing protein [Streptomyces fuscichromogenes]GGN22617.1 gentisate 1,2-dioxygenase [Streptomyces fuscichromogenes]